MSEGWIALTRSATLKAGETRRCTLNSRHYAVWKDHKQRVQLVPDACKHRGASLSMGRVISDGARAGCVECPYHGHLYSGKKIFKPWCEGSEAYQSDFDMRESDGLLWVRPRGLEGPEPPEVPYQVPGFDTSWFETTIDQCAQLILENGIDPSHASYVHANPFGFGTADEEPTNVSHESNRIDFDYVPNRDALSSQLFGINTTRNSHLYALPYTTWSDVTINDGKILMTWVSLCPMEEKRTKMHVAFSQNFGVPSDWFVLMGRQIVEQDRRILESQDSSFAYKGVAGKHDELVVAYRTALHNLSFR
jgi:phenylpropionate dioxygenase-like ring-hydroxylating dioxygenase large terminal subunit